MPEKKCKSCAMEIPKEAKVCPYCRKPQGLTVCAWMGILFIGLFLFAVIMVSSGNNKQKVNMESAPAQDTVSLTFDGGGIKSDHPTWSNKDCNTIAEKRISIGMSAEQVRASWGEPTRINTTLTSYGNSDQWVMPDGSYLNFVNDKLRSIQQTK